MDEVRQRFIGWASMHISFALSLKKAFKVSKTHNLFLQQTKNRPKEEDCVESSWKALRYLVYFKLWLGVREN